MKLATFKLLLLIAFIAMLNTSCTRVLLKVFGVSSPVVQTDQSIMQFQERKLKDTLGYHAVLKPSADWLSTYTEQFSGEPTYEVFNKDGKRLCLKLPETQQSYCEAEAFTYLIDSLESRFVLCTEDTITLKHRLSQLKFFYDAPHELDGFDFIVIARWAKFLRAKATYAEQVLSAENQLSKSDKKILFIKLNLDLNASWGLPEGYKVKMKVARNGREIEGTWNFMELYQKTAKAENQQ